MKEIFDNNWRERRLMKANGNHFAPYDVSIKRGAFGIESEEYFNRLLSLERKRSERSGDPFVLVLMDIGGLYSRLQHTPIDLLCRAIVSRTRDTDLVGWYQHPDAIGAICTTLGDADRQSIVHAITERMRGVLGECLDSEHFGHVRITFHFFPEDYDGSKPDYNLDEKLYPDITKTYKRKKVYGILKRSLDIVGSLSGIIILSPIFLTVPLLIKMTSEGPVLFRQRRIGHLGKGFTFLKFRSMKTGCSHEIHKEYVENLINKKKVIIKPGEEPVYKIIDDPRVTSIGRFLRKTSLDELPQLINVLKGEMSLVGPRPPIPYEVASYRYWHRRRVIEVKPGITGLWQVYGRSRTTFDDMVRLDLQYIEAQSIWLDMKILFNTPRAVLIGAGAY
jgi:lipopolysaccharide/colanic/teichoic acid biosynthesis glycosyltransferase